MGILALIIESHHSHYEINYIIKAIAAQASTSNYLTLAKLLENQD